MIHGRGPRKGEIIVLTAHSDHLGIRSPIGGDSISNGADDNASGTVALLAIANALQRSGVDRSVLFLWPTAEEHDMKGSRWFVDHSTVPLDSIVTVLNLDMVGRGEGPPSRKNPPDLLRVIIGGPSSELAATIFSVSALARRPLALDTSDVEGAFCSSDQASFLPLRIPVAFFTTDKHVDYHGVTDEAARIDYDRLRRVAELVADVARSFEDRPRRATAADAKGYRSCAG